MILDRATAGEVAAGPLSEWHQHGKVIAAFEVRPAHVMQGSCEAGTRPLTLHEDEPAVAWTHRTATTSAGGETVVHPFSPRFFHAILALRADNANGIG